MKYLGTIISAEGMRPDPSKIQAISEMPTLSDKASVCRLLGMINFLAPHVSDMATIVAPLRELIKTDTCFQWNSAAEDALTHIKDVLSTQGRRNRSGWSGPLFQRASKTFEQTKKQMHGKQILILATRM